MERSICDSDTVTRVDLSHPMNDVMGMEGVRPVNAVIGAILLRFGDGELLITLFMIGKRSGQ